VSIISEGHGGASGSRELHGSGTQEAYIKVLIAKSAAISLDR
jgi:hypothetical protein